MPTAFGICVQATSSRDVANRLGDALRGRGWNLTNDCYEVMRILRSALDDLGYRDRRAAARHQIRTAGVRQIFDEDREHRESVRAHQRIDRLRRTRHAADVPRRHRETVRYPMRLPVHGPLARHGFRLRRFERQLRLERARAELGREVLFADRSADLDRRELEDLELRAFEVDQLRA